MRPRDDFRAGWVCHPEGRTDVRWLTGAVLARGANAYPVPRPSGGFDLLVVLSPEMVVRVDGREFPVAALVPPETRFTILPASGTASGDDESVPVLVFHPAGVPAIAGALSVTRCGLCRDCLDEGDTVVRCPGCGIALCMDCAAAGVCPRCETPLFPEPAG